MEVAEVPVQVTSGRVLAQDDDGGCLLQERDGRLHILSAKQTHRFKRRMNRSSPWERREELGKAMLAELPKGLSRHKTPNTFGLLQHHTEAYAKWNSSLYERLYRGFWTYWSGSCYVAGNPRVPLVAVIFDTREGYLEYAKKEDVKNAEGMIGYYNQLSNRIATYDLTGIEGVIRRQSCLDRRTGQYILAQPIAETLGSPRRPRSPFINWPIIAAFRLGSPTIQSPSARD